MEMIITLVAGIFVGMANIIPGVSGGTIAVVFNIYDKLLNSITFNIKKLIKNWKFVVPVFAGMAIGILVFSKGIQFLYNRFPLQTNYAFMGLIFGSIPLIVGLMNESRTVKSTGNVVLLGIFIIAGLLLILGFGYLEARFGSKDSLSFYMPDWTFGMGIKVFIGGFLGAVGMIIPGISGSLLMLILGVYPIIITAIPAFFAKESMVQAFLFLFPFGLGVLAGLLIGAKVISILINKFPSYTYAVILGLIFGSIYTIFPGFSSIKGVGCGIGCALCFAGGTAIAYFSSKLTAKKENIEVSETEAE